MGWFGKKKEMDEEEFSDTDDLLPPLPPLDGEEDLGMPMKSSPKTVGLPPSFDMPRAPQSESIRPAIPQQAKVFVRLDKYKDIMQTIEDMHKKVDELSKTIGDISAIKNKESEIMAGWTALLSDAKAKIDEVNTKLARPGEY